MNYLYMNEQGQQVQYYQFPKFLLELPLSQNARIIYMLLYDRARISRKNNWADEDGRVYAVFPIEELSQKTGKCKSSIKIDGASRREAMANDNMQTMKNILKI